MNLRAAPIGRLLIGILNVALMTFAVWIWQHGQIQIEAPSKVAAKHLSAPDLSAIDAASPLSIDTAVLTNNAVFYSSRIFYRPPPPVQVSVPPDVVLTGIMALGEGKRIAFLQKAGDAANRTVHVSDDVDGWRVESITASGVTVSKDGQKFDLMSKSGSADAGLLRSMSAPSHAALSGIKFIGGGGTPHSSVEPIVTAARTYRPPPH